MDYKTGVLQSQTVIYKRYHTDNSLDDTYRDHLKRTFRRALVDSMRYGVDYFLRVDVDEWQCHEGYFGGPLYEFTTKDDSVFHQTGILLLVDWSKCEIGDATIGRPEWVDWHLSAIAVPGPDGGVWRFQAEKGISILPYVNIWRRET